jgi:ribosome-associated protein
MLTISPRIQIPLEEFDFSFARSGGPGGQNVNKVNSKAVMRWAATTSPSLPEDVRRRFVTKYTSRLTAEGELIVTSQRYRDQSSNIEDCLEKVREMLVTVAVAPVPRRPTKPSRAANIRRTEEKRDHSRKKQQRRAPQADD